MGTGDDLALSWANGFIHGMEHLALAFQTRLDAGQEPGGAILASQVAGLIFVEGLVANFRDRGAVVDLLRRGGACDD